jgi:hypothetical protein
MCEDERDFLVNRPRVRCREQTRSISCHDASSISSFPYCALCFCILYTCIQTVHRVSQVCSFAKHPMPAERILP